MKGEKKSGKKKYVHIIYRVVRNGLHAHNIIHTYKLILLLYDYKIHLV